MDAITRERVREMAIAGLLPSSWRRCGDAAADMVGVLWTDTAGVTYVGAAESLATTSPTDAAWVVVPAESAAARLDRWLTSRRLKDCGFFDGFGVPPWAA